MSKQTAIYFFQYLAPWRIDVFNEMAKRFKLSVVLFNTGHEGFTYNKELMSRLEDVDVIELKHQHPLLVWWEVIKVLEKLRPSVVYTHEYPAVSIYLRFFKRLFGFKFIVSTSDNLSMARGVALKRKLARDFVMASVDGIVLYSDDVEQYYQVCYPGVPTDVCPNIQNPAKLLRFRDKTVVDSLKEKFGLGQSRVILYVGRLTAVKGLPLLIESFCRVSSPDDRLVFVGEGAQKEALVALSIEKGIEERVIFAGQQYGKSLYAWYDIADFLVLPSLYEPFGAVVNEALIFGCPVVVSKHIGALSYVNENNGIIMDPENAESIDSALKQAQECFKNSFGRDNLMSVSFEDSVQALISIAG